MKVRLKYASASPEGAKPAGTVVEVEAAEGKRLIDERQAETVEDRIESAEAVSGRAAKRKARDEARAKAAAESKGAE